MSSPQPAIAFDARPLTEPVDQRAVSAFQKQLRARRGSSVSAGTIVGLVIGGVAVLIAVPILIGAFASLARSGSSFGLVPLVLVIVVIGGGLLAFWLGRRRGRIVNYRLHRFAQANGMSFEDRIKDPPLPGMVFQLGSNRIASELVRGTVPRFVEFGNYQYTTGSGKNQTTHRWGYVAVKLDVPLPNIVLDAVGNNSVFGSNLPASLQKSQRLSLEGDFDKYFELYCPAGYERDALYLFTPDIMARFIDNAAQLDVEIVDDWLFLYTQRRVSTLDPATWGWLFGVVGALITKFDQWARWRDERLRVEQGPDAARTAGSAASAAPGAAPLPFAPPVGMLTPPPGVAQEGRRLKRGVNWVAIVGFVVIAVLFFLMRMH